MREESEQERPFFLESFGSFVVLPSSPCIDWQTDAEPLWQAGTLASLQHQTLLPAMICLTDMPRLDLNDSGIVDLWCFDDTSDGWIVDNSAAPAYRLLHAILDFRLWAEHLLPRLLLLGQDLLLLAGELLGQFFCALALLAGGYCIKLLFYAIKLRGGHYNTDPILRMVRDSVAFIPLDLGVHLQDFSPKPKACGTGMRQGRKKLPTIWLFN